MRILLLATLLAGCGLGFDQETPGPETAEECTKAGGTVRQEQGALYCDNLPASGGFAAAAQAHAAAGDAGAHD